jgi:hypothetical protein
MQIALVKLPFFKNAANMSGDRRDIATEQFRYLRLCHPQLVTEIADIHMHAGSVAINQKAVSRGLVFMQMHRFKFRHGQSRSNRKGTE